MLKVLCNIHILCWKRKETIQYHHQEHKPMENKEV